MSSNLQQNPFVSKLNTDPTLPVFGVQINNSNNRASKKEVARNPSRPKSSSSIMKPNNHRGKKLSFKTFTRARQNDRFNNIPNTRISSKVTNKTSNKSPATAQFQLARTRPLSANNVRELAKASTTIQNQIHKPIKNLFNEPATINLTDQQKHHQSTVGVGNERWVSVATKNVMNEYKKMDEDKAAEIWLANKAITDIKPVQKETTQRIKSQPETYDVQFLNRIGLDRKCLRKAGLSNKTIDRVYRALFVYSFGFHEMLDEVSNNCANNVNGGSGKLVAKIWEVFNALLEKCENDGYKTMIASLQQDYIHQRETIVKSYERRLIDAGVIRDKILSDLQIRTDERDNAHKILAQKINSNANLMDIISGHLSTIANAEAELVAAKDEMLNARKRERQATGELRKSENVILKLRQDITDEEMKRADISGQLREYKSIKDDALRKEKNATTMMNKLEMEIGTIQSIKNELRKELDREIRSRATEAQRAEALERNVLLLQSHLQRTNKDITTLEERIKKKNIEIKIKNNKIDQLYEKITNVDQAKKKAEENLSDVTTKFNTLFNANEKLKHEKDTVSERLNQLIAKEINLRKSLSDMDNIKDQLKNETNSVKLMYENTVLELRETNSNFSKTKYDNMKLGKTLDTANNKIKALKDTITNNKKERNDLKLHIDDLQNTIKANGRKYEELQNICYKQLHDMGQKMISNMEKVKEATTLNANTMPQIKEMKNTIIKLKKKNEGLNAQNNSLKNSLDAEQFKSLSFMKIISLQQDLAMVIDTSMRQQKQDMEYIQTLCDETPWGSILNSPSNREGTGYDVSTVSAIWVSSIVSNALRKIVKQYNFNYGINEEEDEQLEKIGIENSNNSTDDENNKCNIEIVNALTNIENMKQNIVKKSTKQFRVHEINKEMINTVKAKITKIQDIFYHRLHRDNNIVKKDRKRKIREDGL